MRLDIKPSPLFFNKGSVFFKPLSERQNVIKTFKEVKSKIYNMDGGAGNLQEAVDKISDRIKNYDTQAFQKMETAGDRLGMFLRNANKVDLSVARMVKTNQEEFFKQYPCFIPPPPPKKKSRWEKFKEGCRKIGRAIVKGVKKAVNWVKDTAKKVWKKTVDFCKKHWKAIVKVVVGVVIIAGLAALSVFTGGAAAPLFAVAAKGAAIAACTGAAVTTVTGIAKGQSFGEIFDGAANSFLVGSITGAAGGFAGAAGGAVTSATGSQLLGQVAKIGVETTGNLLANGASYLIDNGTLKGYMDKQGYDILKAGGMSALSAVGSAATSYFKDVGKNLLGSTFKGLKDSQLVNSFKNAYKFCENQMPTLTKVATNTIKDTFGNMSFSDLAKLKNPSEFAKGIGNSLLNNLAGEAKGSIGDFINKDLNNITGGAVSKVSDFVSGVTKDIKNSEIGKAVSGAYSEVKDYVGGIKGEINNVIGQAGSAIGDAFGSAKNQFGSVVSQIASEFKGVTGAYKDLTNSLGGISNQVGKAVSNTIGDIGKSVTGSIGDLTGSIGKQIGSAMGDIGSKVGSIGSDVSKGISGGSSFISKEIGGITSKISNSIASGTSYLGNELKGIEGKLGNIFNSAASNISKTAVPALSKISGSFANALSSISSKAMQSSSSTVTKAANTALSYLSKTSVKGTIGSVVSSLF